MFALVAILPFMTLAPEPRSMDEALIQTVACRPHGGRKCRPGGIVGGKGGKGGDSMIVISPGSTVNIFSGAGNGGVGGPASGGGAPSGGGSSAGGRGGVWYAVAGSFANRAGADSLAARLGGQWSVRSSSICGSFTQGLWVVVAGGGGVEPARSLAARAGGYARRCV